MSESLSFSLVSAWDIYCRSNKTLAEELEWRKRAQSWVKCKDCINYREDFQIPGSIAKYTRYCTKLDTNVDKEIIRKCWNFIPVVIKDG